MRWLYKCDAKATRQDVRPMYALTNTESGLESQLTAQKTETKRNTSTAERRNNAPLIANENAPKMPTHQSNNYNTHLTIAAGNSNINAQRLSAVHIEHVQK